MAMWDCRVPVILPFSIRLKVAMSIRAAFDTWERVSPFLRRRAWMFAPRCFMGMSITLI